MSASSKIVVSVSEDIMSRLVYALSGFFVSVSLPNANMNILLDGIIHSGTFSGLKTGTSIHEFKSLYPAALAYSTSETIFKIPPVQYSFSNDTLYFISLKCYYPNMKYFFENTQVQIFHSIHTLKALLKSKNISFYENKTFMDIGQINLEVNAYATFIYSVSETNEYELAQIDSL